MSIKSSPDVPGEIDASSKADTVTRAWFEAGSLVSYRSRGIWSTAKVKSMTDRAAIDGHRRSSHATWQSPTSRPDHFGASRTAQYGLATWM